MASSEDSSSFVARCRRGAVTVRATAMGYRLAFRTIRRGRRVAARDRCGFARGLSRDFGRVFALTGGRFFVLFVFFVFFASAGRTRALGFAGAALARRAGVAGRWADGCAREEDEEDEEDEEASTG